MPTTSGGLVAVLALTAVCVALAPETSRIDLHADPAAGTSTGRDDR